MMSLHRPGLLLAIVAAVLVAGALLIVHGGWGRDPEADASGLRGRNGSSRTENGPTLVGGGETPSPRPGDGAEPGEAARESATDLATAIRTVVLEAPSDFKADTSWPDRALAGVPGGLSALIRWYLTDPEEPSPRAGRVIGSLVSRTVPRDASTAQFEETRGVIVSAMSEAIDPKRWLQGVEWLAQMPARPHQPEVGRLTRTALRLAAENERARLAVLAGASRLGLRDTDTFAALLPAIEAAVDVQATVKRPDAHVLGALEILVAHAERVPPGLVERLLQSGSDELRYCGLAIGLAADPSDLSPAISTLRDPGLKSPLYERALMRLVRSGGEHALPLLADLLARKHVWYEHLKPILSEPLKRASASELSRLILDDAVAWDPLTSQIVSR